MDSKDTFLAIMGFLLSLYGGFSDKLEILVSGVLLIVLTFWFTLQEQEENVRVLQAQINTQIELKRIWREIDNLKDGKTKKR